MAKNKKTEGELQIYMYKIAKFALVGVGFFMVMVSILTPFVDPEVLKRWFSIPNIYYLSAVPLATAITFISTWVSLKNHREKSPFFLSVSIFLLGFLGLAISSWPYLVPHEITIWQAAAPRNSLIFLLIGTAILLPILLGYTWYAYHIFRGKVTKDSGYHA